MTPAWHLLMFTLCLGAFAALALGMERPQETLLQRPLGVAASRAWRLAGWGLLAAALWLALAAPGWTRGLVALSGHTSAAAALVLLALVLRERWGATR